MDAPGSGTKRQQAPRIPRELVSSMQSHNGAWRKAMNTPLPLGANDIGQLIQSTSLVPSTTILLVRIQWAQPFQENNNRGSSQRRSRRAWEDPG